MLEVTCPNCRRIVASAAVCSYCGTRLAAGPEVGEASERPASPVMARAVAMVAETTSAPAAPAAPSLLEPLTSTETGVATEIDPRLQRVMLRNNQGIAHAPTASANSD